MTRPRLSRLALVLYILRRRTCKGGEGAGGVGGRAAGGRRKTSVAEVSCCCLLSPHYAHSAVLYCTAAQRSAPVRT